MTIPMAIPIILTIVGGALLTIVLLSYFKKYDK